MIRRMNDIDHAVDAYVGELARRGLSKATRTKYQAILFKFCVHVDAKPVPEITRLDCTSFLDRWVDASRSTIALHTTILTGFFAFLVDLEAIESSPMAKVRRPRRPRPEDLDVVSSSDDDVDRMFAAVADWDELLCIGMIGYLGPRRTAAARVRRRDIDLERGTIRFREKGSKVIEKPIPLEYLGILKAAEEAGVWIGPEDYVIPNRRPSYRKGERSAKVIYSIVTRVADRARVRSHPHALRAAFAVRFAEQKPDQIVALKDLMGHVRLETTLVYLRRRDKAIGMEAVRDLSWGSSRLPSSSGVPPAGFEPAFRESALPEPLGRKLDELRARSRSRVADRR